MKCPRKLENPYWNHERDKDDEWQSRDIFQEVVLDKYCSHCGSLHPHVFLDLVEKGAELIPTDKDYKAYIRFKKSQTKFYFQHLSREDINRYIELSEKRKINFGYPGFFYKKPYFLLLEVVSPFAFGAIITLNEKVEDGAKISLINPIYSELLRTLRSDPDFIYKINPRIWEEIIAATYDKAGFDEVILTPRSGDYGRDVIAIKKGFGSIRFIEQVKAYNQNHIVNAEEVRALLGVLQADPKATKAIFTTTSDFAPTISEDKFIKPFLPFRLELLNKDKLINRLFDDD
jgi:restriction system protein